MKKLLAALLLLLPLAAVAQAPQKPIAYVFTAPSCVHCIKFKKEQYPTLKQQYGQYVEFMDLSTADRINALKLMNLAKQYDKEAVIPAFIVGDYFLAGDEITQGAREALEQTLQQKGITREIGEVSATEVFKTFTFATILFNGLVDGVNPCAFAVIVFLISFLSVYKYTKKEVIYVGSAYCLAVFITYVLLGLGIFNALYALQGFHIVIKVFYILTALACFIFFGLSVYDFIIYMKTKDSKAMLLTLPSNLKVRINKIIGFFLRDKEKSAPRLIMASLAVGFVVSLVEAVCTGQVYIPTVVLILKDPAFRVRAVFYILLYNVMFILPLLAVFAMAVAGQKSESLNNFFKKHLAIVKALLSLVFLTLGIMLVYYII